MRLSWAVVFLTLSAPAQPVMVGLRAGARVTGDIEGGAASESKPYLIGPMVEVRLPHRFALEADALYSRFGYSSTAAFSILRDPFTQQPLVNVVTERARANSWEFPLLARYRLAANVYALAGYAPRRVSGNFDSTGYAEISSSGQIALISGSGTASYPTNHALVAGVGIGWRIGPFRIEPELRYLRWKDAPGPLSGDSAVPVLAYRNEAQILVAVGWSGK